MQKLGYLSARTSCACARRISLLRSTNYSRMLAFLFAGNFCPILGKSLKGEVSRQLYFLLACCSRHMKKRTQDLLPLRPQSHDNKTKSIAISMHYISLCHSLSFSSETSPSDDIREHSLNVGPPAPSLVPWKLLTPPPTVWRPSVQSLLYLPRCITKYRKPSTGLNR